MQVVLDKGFMEKLIELNKADERKAAQHSVRKFVNDPSNPGLSLERLRDVRDRNLWSMRVGRDVRIILHRSKEAWLVLYVAHHDDAYRWAGRVKVDRHPATGGLQIVHTEEVYREVVLKHAPPITEDEPLFAHHEDGYLLSLGIPREALPTARGLRTEEALLGLCGSLPEDVAERLVSLYLGEDPASPEPVAPEESPLETPDAQRHLFPIEDEEELERALSAPWDQWAVFLHPLQRHAAYADQGGPTVITGSAGTGKTVVALHRARYVARRGMKVLLTTFSSTLAADLEAKRDLLCDPTESGKISVGTVYAAAQEILQAADVRFTRVQAQTTGRMLGEARRDTGVRFSQRFLQTEWDRVIVAQGIEGREQYREAPRAGRGVPLRAGERDQLWEVFGRVRGRLAEEGKMTFPDTCRAARKVLEAGVVDSPYDAVVVDEVQDLNPQEILFLKALGGLGENGITLVGDRGQRIYPGGFSLRALGIEVRGRSLSLPVNYRTSRQIQGFADRLLDGEAGDVDQGMERRGGTRNLLPGPQPEVRGFRNASEEEAWVARRISGLVEGGHAPDKIGVFARLNARLKGVELALKRANVKPARLKKGEYPAEDGCVKLGTMHRAKGLEFRAVFVVSVNRDVLPESGAVGDPDDALEREAALRRERQLLYVSATRARERLYVYYHGPPSLFLTEAGLILEE